MKKLDPFSLTIYKTHFNVDKGLHVRPKTLKLLEEEMGIDETFLKRTPIVKTMKFW